METRKDETQPDATAPADSIPKGLPWQAKAAIGSVIGVLLAGALLVIAFACGSQRAAAPKPQAHRNAKPAAYGVLHNTSLGAPEARVELLLVVPLNIDCHAPTIEYLKQTAGTCGAQVRVRFLELRSPEARDVFAKASKDPCATLFINGKFQVTGLAGKQVTLTGPLGDRYVLGDVRAAIDAEMRKSYSDGALTPPEAPASTAEKPAPSSGDAGAAGR